MPKRLLPGLQHLSRFQFAVALLVFCWVLGAVLATTWSYGPYAMLALDLLSIAWLVVVLIATLARRYRVSR